VKNLEEEDDRATSHINHRGFPLHRSRSPLLPLLRSCRASLVSRDRKWFGLSGLFRTKPSSTDLKHEVAHLLLGLSTRLQSNIPIDAHFMYFYIYRRQEKWITFFSRIVISFRMLQIAHANPANRKRFFLRNTVKTHILIHVLMSTSERLSQFNLEIHKIDPSNR
jgi:hypothetical protein